MYRRTRFHSHRDRISNSIGSSRRISSRRANPATPPPFVCGRFAGLIDCLRCSTGPRPGRRRTTSMPAHGVTHAGHARVSCRCLTSASIRIGFRFDFVSTRKQSWLPRPNGQLESRAARSVKMGNEQSPCVDLFGTPKRCGCCGCEMVLVIN